MLGGMTPAERTTRASIAAHHSWAKTPDRSRRTAPARQAAHERFERLVDPNGTMTLEQRANAAESLRAAHFRQMALKSHEARRAKRRSA